MNENTWRNLKINFEQQLEEIKIPSDLNPGIAKQLLAKLDPLYTEVFLVFPEIRTEDDNISQLLSNTMKLGAINGTNPDVRAANAIRAATEYTLNEQVVNLFGMKQVTNERLVYINSIIKILESKRQLLITASGYMKIEAIY